MGHLRSGKLRHLGHIIQRTEVSDSGAPQYGDWETAWENVWASIEPARGATAEESGYEQDRVVCNITIRHRDGVTNRMRFRHLADSGTVDYDINSVMDPDGRRAMLKLVCIRSEVAE
jgi:SPP1 family predicted phage head-tail adaptor